MAGLDAAPVFAAAGARVGDFLHVKDGTDTLGTAPLGTGSSGFLHTLRTIVANGFTGYYILENKYSSLKAAEHEIAAFREILRHAAQQA